MFMDIILGVLIFLIYYFIKKFRHTHGMPPGEFGWPIIGYSLLNDVSLFDQVEKMKQKHGKTFTWKLGSRYFVYLCDYKVLKTAFATAQASHRPKAFSLDFFSDFKRLGFVNNIGQSIQNLRRFTLTYLRNSGMGKSSMENIIVYELEFLIEDFKRHTGKPVEIPWSLNIATINVLWKLLADKRFNITDDKMQRFERLITDIFNDAQHPLLLLFDAYPILSKLPIFLQKKLGLADAYKRIEEFHEFLRNSIDEHQNSVDYDNPRDFIDFFLLEMKAIKNEKCTEKNFNFTYKELLYALSDMFSAGSETTSSTFRWIIFYLTKYPEVQRKVHQEIDRALPRDRLPTYTDREKLVYTQAVINEVLRLAPIASFGLHHSVSEDFVIDGFRIPKDTIVVPSILSCHMDPDYWNDPKEFNPERFINADDETLDINKEGYTPFLTGRRVCIGESLVRMHLFFFVTGVLQKFSFTAPEGIEISLERNIKQPFFMLPPENKVIMSERE